MKVRHKLSGEIWEVVDEKNDFLFGYREQDGKYVNVDAYQLAAMRKSEYEPIPTEPRWQDVTGECEVDGIGDLRDGQERTIFILRGDHQATYRLRKVPVIMQNDHKHDGDAFDTTVRAAFVVERKVE